MSNILKNNIQVIPVFPVGRAGSLLFQSIFDNNNDFFTFPTFAPVYTSIPEFINCEKKSVENFCSDFWSKNQDIFDLEKGYLSDINLSNNDFNKENLALIKKIIISKSFFIERFLEFIQFVDINRISRKNIFFIICKILNKKIFGRDNFKYLIYNGHDQKDAKKIIEECDIKLSVCLTRNPLSGWSSWKKVLKNRHLIGGYGKLSKFHLIQFMYNYIGIYNFLEKNILHKNHKMIDLIDLHQNHKRILKIILKDLNAKFSDNFLTSTFYGVPWYGNAANKKKISGFDEKKKDSFDDLDNEEIFLITKFIISRCQKLKYNEVTVKRVKINLRLKKELFLYFLQQNYFNFKKFTHNNYGFKRLLRGILNYKKYLVYNKKKYSEILREIS